jgi:hypothetical protein
MGHREKNSIQIYANSLREQDQSRPTPVNLPQIDNNTWQEYFKQQYLIEQIELEEYFSSGDSGGSDSGLHEPEYVFIDPLPSLPNEDAWIRMNGWCSGGYGVGGNSERVLRPNHPQFQLPQEVTVNGRLAYYTEIGGEKIIFNDTLNRWELLAMWYGNGDPNNPLLGVGTGTNIPFPFYATWTTYIDPVFNASIKSIEKVAVGTTKAPDPGPPC